MCDESRSHGVGSTENLKRLGENSDPGVTATLGSITQGEQGGVAAKAENQGVTYTARTPGAAGNGIEIELEENRNQIETTVTENVANRTVLIRLAGDPVNNIVSVTTVTDVVSAVNDANLTLITASGSGSMIVRGVSWSTSGGTGVTESVDLTIDTGANATGTITVKVAGVDHTVAVTAGQTAAQVAAAIAAQLTADGVLGYSVNNPSGAIVRFTSTTQFMDVPDLTVSVN
ncbi:hypothetical protein BRE01_65470 [Brevibacillus reuszeri]|uniref:Uncharacterized protein n=1 Tax=Brevibacillus reuszeri TaxID=54915 RepID=A0A0K9YZH5_9BACL|nr:hypothetical protein [Brevibacillus reuszeri]KNB74061.1 hypothetical protein ADS79_09150 [Brevibacillus reuszeri]MED1861643.1 hypothetical protein [Brevibacillus reuszeri]GED72845.1 hypothetical protein BRE01_65470 [Brevibacillus reuszeri]